MKSFICLFSYPPHKLGGFFNNLEIRHKLVLSYFFVTIIPVVAVGALFYSSTLNYLKSQYTVTVYNTQQQYDVNLTNSLNSYKYLTDAIYNDQKIQSYLDGSYSGYLEGTETVNNYIRPALTALLESTGRSINLDLVKYNEAGFEVITNYIRGISNGITQTNGSLKNPDKAFNIINVERIKDKDWFPVVENSDTYLWEQLGDDDAYGRVTLIRPLISFPATDKRRIGFIFATVMLDGILGKEKPSNDSEEIHLVFDRNKRLLTAEEAGRSFFSRNRAELVKLLAAGGESGSLFLNDHIVVKGRNGLTGWEILTASPIGRLKENIDRTRNLTVLYCLTALLVLFLITFLISSSFSRRIIRISKRMEKFHEGVFEGTTEDHHNDEIGYLERTFDEMTEKLGCLIRDNYVANIDKKEAQLKALQAQINPHFLYNSLSCISRLGNIGDSDNINKMVRALTTFYRMSLNRGKDIIRIADELEQIKAYLQIYEVRKGEDFRVLLDIDEAVLDYYTVKMILQPFVENVFEHAIYNRTGPINIIISAQPEEESIVFKIIDDGIGMNRKKLEAVYQGGGEPTGGYGVRNVDDRIKLQFGNSFGVEIFSSPGMGTSATVRIPRYRMKEA